MLNKLWIIIGILLIVSLTALYLSFNSNQNLGEAVSELGERIDNEAQRINQRTYTNVYSGEPVGYVIEFENGASFYIAGDTGPSADMKTVVGEYYQPDVAVLPIGGYFTMGPKEAAFSASLVNPSSYLIPYHYASYPMLTQDPAEFSNALKSYNLRAQPMPVELGVEKEIMGVKVTWLGHASLLLVSPEGKKILVDPATVTGLWPEKYKDFSAFGTVDMILITHGHPDHVVVADVNAIGAMYQPIVIAPYELGGWLQEKVNVPELVFALSNKGARITKFEFQKVGLPVEKIGDITVNIVSANHSSSVSPQ